MKGLIFKIYRELLKIINIKTAQFLNGKGIDIAPKKIYGWPQANEDIDHH